MGGLYDINAPGQNVTLDGPTNDFSSVQIDANNASLADQNAISFGLSKLTGALDARADTDGTNDGGISDSGVITVGGTATFAAGVAGSIGATNDIIINNFGTDFQGPVNVLAADGVTLFDDAGNFEIATLKAEGAVSASATGAVIPSGNLLLSANYSAGDTATFTAAANLEVTGTLETGANIVTLNAGTGPIPLGSLTTLGAGGKLVAADGLLVGDGDVIRGAGTVDVGAGTSGLTIGTGGQIEGSPNPPALLVVDGDLTFDGGTLFVRIAGTALSAFDQIEVTGNTDLGAGTAKVDVDLVPGTPRAVGDEYVVVFNDGTVSGSFASTTVVTDGVRFDIDLTGGDGNDIRLTIAQILTPRNLAVGGSVDGQATVFAPDAAGQYGSPTVLPAVFGAISSNVRAATADVNGDGSEDTILITGPGVPIRFAVVSGADNTTLLVAPTAPFAGSEDFTGGGFVSAADFDGDGNAEMVFSPDLGGGPRVTIFSLVAGVPTVAANFFGIDDPNFRGGARTGAGDVNGDGVPDLAVAAGFQGGPRIALFGGTTVFSTPTRLVNDFFAFEDTLRNGAYVAIGDLNGDGFGDLFFGAGPGGAPRMLAISGQQLLSDGPVAAIDTPLANFFVAGNTADRGGVRVATKDADLDGIADLAVGSGEGSPADVRVYLGKNFTGTGEPSVFQDLAVFGSTILTDGVFVG